MKLVATYRGQKYDIGEPKLKDFVMLERQFGVGASKVGDDPRMEYMVYLAYCALRRQGVVVHRYSDEFLDDLETIEDEDADKKKDGEADKEEQEPADPTGEGTGAQ